MVVDFFPKCCFFFLSVTVRIGQNLLNEVPVASSILTNFANYHWLNFNGNLNGSRKNNMNGSIWTKTAKADDKELSRHCINESFIFLLNYALLILSY